jgi:hypothetical protein
VLARKIVPDYSNYMGVVFEKICREYLERENANGRLPILFTSLGRWWGTDPVKKESVEIDLVAKDGNDHLFGECKWQNEKADIGVLHSLQAKAEIFGGNRGKTWFILFSKAGFTVGLQKEATAAGNVILVDLDEMVD